MTKRLLITVSAIALLAMPTLKHLAARWRRSKPRLDGEVNPLGPFGQMLDEFALQTRLERDEQIASGQDFSGFTVRLRFRVSKRLEIDAYEHILPFGSFKAVLRGEAKGKSIRESTWLILLLQGIPTLEEARKVGLELKAAVVLASARTRLGIDLGDGNPTSGPGALVVDYLRTKYQIETRSNVHGVDIYSEALPVMILNFQAEGSISIKSEPFLSDVYTFFEQDWSLTSRLFNAVLLLNAALVHKEPLAQLILAVSAIESLGQDEKWSKDQKVLRDRLVADARADTNTKTEERDEVAVAISRMHRIGLMQGVRRVLDRTGLAGLYPEWKDIYDRRSSVAHG